VHRDDYILQYNTISYIYHIDLGSKVSILWTKAFHCLKIWLLTFFIVQYSNSSQVTFWFWVPRNCSRLILMLFNDLICWA
jgi:hypothetical protein